MAPNIYLIPSRRTAAHSTTSKSMSWISTAKISCSKSSMSRKHRHTFLSMSLGKKALSLSNPRMEEMKQMISRYIIDSSFISSSIIIISKSRTCTSISQNSHLMNLASYIKNSKTLVLNNLSTTFRPSSVIYRLSKVAITLKTSRISSTS